MRHPTSPAESLVGWRTAFLSGIGVIVGVLGAFIARALLWLINFFTHLFFYGRFSGQPISLGGHPFGAWVILIPALGGLIVGVLARFGSMTIRGHGIPEAMEQVLFNRSRIPARVLILKPLSGALSIGSGGPFGAEGPIIATGGALGSLVGQLLRTTADERKIILAAGAAAGMAGIFGSPVAAVLLAVELLLFEYRVRSLIPVSLASVTAAGVRSVFVGSSPVFAMPGFPMPGLQALALYVVVGLAAGLGATVVTRLVYLTEDWFNKLPIHWMWWPALGGLAVGLIGYLNSGTLGLGYDNITNMLSGALVGRVLYVLCFLKFISWTVSLASGTSGGTLAPLFTFGGGVGAFATSFLLYFFPHSGLDVRVGTLVGMAALFAGASRALLASVVFAFETTLQPYSLGPLLAGCAAAYFVACALTRESIMTEKIARRGVHVPEGYAADFLSQIYVRAHATKQVITLKGEDTIEEVRRWLEAHPENVHHGYPVADAKGKLLGVVTYEGLYLTAGSDKRPVRDIATEPAVTIEDNATLREAADQMVLKNVGRLLVVQKKTPDKVIGILSRTDILRAHSQRLHEMSDMETSIELHFPHIGPHHQTTK